MKIFESHSKFSLKFLNYLSKHHWDQQDINVLQSNKVLGDRNDPGSRILYFPSVLFIHVRCTEQWKSSFFWYLFFFFWLVFPSFIFSFLHFCFKQIFKKTLSAACIE